MKTGRKHCGKRRNCSLRAISPFPTVFSKGLYRRHVKTRACLFGKGLKTAKRFGPYQPAQFAMADMGRYLSPWAPFSQSVASYLVEVPKHANDFSSPWSSIHVFEKGFFPLTLNPKFYRPWVGNPSKICGKKEKILLTSIFSLSHRVFSYRFRIRFYQLK